MLIRRIPLSVVILVLLLTATVELRARCMDAGTPLGVLIKGGPDDGEKVPLILIHGINGTSANASLDVPHSYWKSFSERFAGSDDGLSSRYALYFYQYCSNREPVKAIAGKMRDEIDAKLADRPHVIVAHSMGGLVAKSYMAETLHGQGGWQQRTGGETVLGLITLATPHHGTPGANDPDALAGYVSETGWNYRNRWMFSILSFVYWNKDGLAEIGKKASENCAEGNGPNAKSRSRCLMEVMLSDGAPSIAGSSTQVNRRDLRWDNYDGKLTSDINEDLAATNRLFERYKDKTIVYAGALRPSEPDFSMEVFSNHGAALAFTNGILFFSLRQAFGYTDGMVPYRSAMFCDAGQPSPPSFECRTPYRVRRFEFGPAEQSGAMPNTQILSVVRAANGFNHEEMLISPLVLDKLKEDLLGMPAPKPRLDTDERPRRETRRPPGDRQERVTLPFGDSGGIKAWESSAP